MLRSRKKIAVIGAVLGGVALVAALGFGPLVRARVAKEAERRGLFLEVGGVRPAWMAVRLLDVHVRPEGADSIAAEIAEIRVELRGNLSVDRIRAKGGEIRLRGEIDEVRRDVSAWRGRRGGGVEHGAGATTAFEGDALRVRWAMSARREIEASGASFARDSGATHVAAEVVRVVDADSKIAIGGASVELDAGGTLRSAHAATLDIDLAGSDPLAPSATASAAPPAPSPSTSSAPAASAGSAIAANPRAPTLLTKTGHGKKRDSLTPPAPPATGPLVPLPDLRGWRALATNVAARVAEHLPDDVAISADAVSAKTSRDGVAISVGPGPVTLARRSGRIELQFASPGGSAGTPLSLQLSLPIGAGDATVRLEGGPVALSVLGVKEGTLGLTDVERATLAGKGRLVLSDDSLTFDGELRARGAALRHARLASDTIRGLDLGIGARGVLSEKGELRLDDLTLSLGALHVSASGVLKQSDDGVAASFRFDVPSASCQSLLESVPTALLPTLRGARYSGTFGARGSFAFDSRAIDDLALTYDIQDQCRVVDAPPAIARDRFKQPFAHRIYLPDGSLSEETTGPGTSKWVSIGGISPFMIVAVQTTEDGGFYRHHGFSHPAIKSSIIANLKARRFVRGASTISMQLAKNLFLLREKTLSRKLEEVVLTDYLEQVFTKDELMELYLNVIEYGPNVYGIGPASQHYFGRNAIELNLAEALFLSSMLPAPLRYHHLKSGGQLSEGWQRTLEHLMTIAKKSGLISEEELEEGKGETVVFYRTGPRPPARRHSHLDAPSSDVPPELEEN